jgi:hypothetical protein
MQNYSEFFHVRIHSHDSQALVSGKTNQGIINSLNKYTQIPETSACAMIFAFGYQPCISGQQEKPAISEIIYSRTK